MLIKYTDSLLFKTMALVLVCLFLANDISFASSALAPQLVTKPQDPTVSMLERNKWVVDYIGRCMYPFLTLTKESKLKNPIDLLKADLQSISRTSERFDINGIEPVRDGDNIIGFSLPIKQDGVFTHKLIYTLQGPGEAIKIGDEAKIYVSVDDIVISVAPPAFVLGKYAAGDFSDYVIDNANGGRNWEELLTEFAEKTGQGLPKTSPKVDTPALEDRDGYGPGAMRRNGPTDDWPLPEPRMGPIENPETPKTDYAQIKSLSDLCEYLGIDNTKINSNAKTALCKTVADYFREAGKDRKVYASVVRKDNNEYIWLCMYEESYDKNIHKYREYFYLNREKIAHGFCSINEKTLVMSMGIDDRSKRHKGYTQIFFDMRLNALRKVFLPQVIVVPNSQVLGWNTFFFYVRKGFMPSDRGARSRVIDKFIKPWQADRNFKVKEPSVVFGENFISKCSDFVLYLQDLETNTPASKPARLPEVGQQVVGQDAENGPETSQIDERPTIAVIEFGKKLAEIAASEEFPAEKLSIDGIVEYVEKNKPELFNDVKTKEEKIVKVCLGIKGPNDDYWTNYAGPWRSLYTDNAKIKCRLLRKVKQEALDRLATLEYLILPEGRRTACFINQMFGCDYENIENIGGGFGSRDTESINMKIAPGRELLELCLYPERRKFVGQWQRDYAELLTHMPAKELENEWKRLDGKVALYSENVQSLIGDTMQRFRFSNLPELPGEKINEKEKRKYLIYKVAKIDIYLEWVSRHWGTALPGTQSIPRQIKPSLEYVRSLTYSHNDSPSFEESFAYKTFTSLSDREAFEILGVAASAAPAEKPDAKTGSKTSQTDTSSAYRYQEYISSVTREANVAWKIGMHGPTAGTLMSLFNEIWKNVPCIITLSGTRKMDGEYFSQEYDNSKSIMPLDFMMLGVREGDKVEIKVESDIFVNTKIINEIADIIKKCFEAEKVDVENPEARSKRFYTTLGQSIYAGLIAKLFPGDGQVRESLEAKFADIIESKGAALKEPKSGTPSESSSDLPPATIAPAAPAANPARLTEVGHQAVGQAEETGQGMPSAIPSSGVKTFILRGKNVSHEEMRKNIIEMLGCEYIFNVEIEADKFFLGRAARNYGHNQIEDPTPGEGVFKGEINRAQNPEKNLEICLLLSRFNLEEKEQMRDLYIRMARYFIENGIPKTIELDSKTSVLIEELKLFIVSPNTLGDLARQPLSYENAKVCPNVLAKKLDDQSPDSERKYAENLKDDINYWLEAKRAEKATEEPKTLYVALGTGWIKGYKCENGNPSFQYDALNPLLSHLRNSYPGQRVEFIIGDDKDLAAELKVRMSEKGPGRVMALAGEETIVKDFKEFNNGENAIFGVDNSNLTEESYMRIMEMLEIEARFILYPDTPPKSRNIPLEKRRSGFWVFSPINEPMKDKGELLKTIYEAQKFA